MKKLLRAKGLLCLAIIAFFSHPVFAQADKEKIAASISEYFRLERENIHVQFNKTIYFTNEEIWFRGYVFHRRKNLPFFTTINVYASLMDSSGKEIDSKLVYSYLGGFSNKFSLNPKIPSGTYYVRFYTNWMNNFSDDESFTQKITIVNQNDDPSQVIGRDKKKIHINIAPEGGTFVAGVTNSFGMSITGDADRYTITDAEIIDSKGTVLQKVQLNRYGYGKFSIPSTQSALKARITVNGQKIEKALPAAVPGGVAMEVNNYGFAGKTLVTLRMTEATKTQLQAGAHLVIHQDDKVSVLSIPINSTEITIPVTDTDFSEGVNTIRVVDNNMKELASRVVYKYPKQSLVPDITVSESNYESAVLKGKINYPNMNLSVTTLPGTTESIEQSRDIFTSLFIDPYIKPAAHVPGRYFLNNISRGRNYELDLYMVCQRPKYEWTNILNNPPKDTFAFEHGLTLKGKVNVNVPDRTKYKVRMFSLIPPMNEFTGVNEKNEFEINNLIVDDSTYATFTLMKAGDKNPVTLKAEPHISNGRQKFLKPFNPQSLQQGEAFELNDMPLPVFARPKIAGSSGEIELEEIKIDKRRLTYANNFGNGNLRGYKITEQEINGNRTLLNFIKTFGGFEVIDDFSGNVRILSRTRTSINGGQSGPIIYIDNVQLLDYSMLTIYQMSEVDEIYMSAQAIVPSLRNYMGIIRVYLKKGVRVNKTKEPSALLIRNGFAKWAKFENITYGSYTDDGYRAFGVIGWEPNLSSDETGEFSFTIPYTGQKEVKVLIEGFSADGVLISEIKTLTLNN